MGNEPKGLSGASIYAALKDSNIMDRYKETFETWNKIASSYQDRFMNLDLYNKSYDFVCHSIRKKEARILEIGCGPGNITKYLLSKRPDFHIYGIDIAPNMIQLAKRNNRAATFKVMDARRVGEIQTTFDGIICGFCLPYLSKSDGKKLIADTSDLLTEGGLIYISFVEGDPIQSGFQTGTTPDRVYFYYYTLDQLKTWLFDKGFEVIKIFKVVYKKSETEEDMHTLVVAKKKRMRPRP
jgi:2-polyprenyl-3-methyl-5-hydroxy-6-metoxy-1,4-benzoquinol methylase